MGLAPVFISRIIGCLVTTLGNHAICPAISPLSSLLHAGMNIPSALAKVIFALSIPVSKAVHPFKRRYE